MDLIPQQPSDPANKNNPKTIDPPTQFSVQKDLVERLNNSAFLTNSFCYLISIKWFCKWDSYSINADKETGLEYRALFGEINNSVLFHDENSLLPNLTENIDYKILTEKAWNALYRWYGADIIVKREILPKNGNTNDPIANIYPVHVQLNQIQKNHKNEPVPGKLLCNFTTLRSNSLQYICNLIKQRFYLNKSVKLIRFDNKAKFKEKRNKTLEDIGIVDKLYLGIKLHKTNSNNSPNNDNKNTKDLNNILIETFNDTSSNTTTHDSSSSPMNNHQEEDKTSSNGYVNGNGLTGLNNLGNTCFMNSALQCLSNTQELTLYFLNKFNEREINKENPLGMGGEVAMAYSSLLTMLWKNSSGSVSPKKFKSTIGKFAPQFVGYSQHDSQEFLAFLFDGLHEDLNRIRNKPYTEIPESQDRPDDELAQEIWNLHKRRNDSIIVDLFQGLFKSTLTCPDCNNKSVTFDPFMYLSLPLPTEKLMDLKINFVRHHSENLELNLKISRNQTFFAVKDLLKKFNEKDTDIYIYEVFNSGIYKTYHDVDVVNEVQASDDIYAYEFVRDPDNLESTLIQALVTTSNDNVVFDYPILLDFGKHEPLEYSKLCTRIIEKLNKYTTADLFEYNSKEPLFKIWKVDNENRPSFNYQCVKRNSVLVTPETINSDMLSTSCRFIVEFENDTYCALFKESDADRFSLSIEGSEECGNGGIAVFKEFKMPSYEYLDSLNVLDGDIKIKSNRPLANIKEKIDLKNCIIEFLKPEKLGKHDEWYCPTCKTHVSAMKKFDLYSLPDHLVVHLKRFNHARYFSKIKDFVDFPVKGLDLTDMARCIKMKETHKEPVLYDLYAISNHYGGMGGGHYTAYCRNYKIDQWVEYDDSRISSVDEESIKSSAAYLLFYKRRNNNTNNSKI